MRTPLALACVAALALAGCTTTKPDPAPAPSTTPAPSASTEGTITVPRHVDSTAALDACFRFVKRNSHVTISHEDGMRIQDEDRGDRTLRLRGEVRVMERPGGEWRDMTCEVVEADTGIVVVAADLH